ncbi:MAG: class I SAM-dependent methyltransferase [Planctomycetes bacterium]|nr:class I SAM-dependent methyltransferase [Planctomycetota bacterium]
MERAEYIRMSELEGRHWWYVGLHGIVENFLKSALEGRPGPFRILDAGCGTGGLLCRLAGHGRAFGVDFSDDALSLARQKVVTPLVRGTVGQGRLKAELQPPSPLVRGSVTSLPFKDETFDAVTSMDVLYHLGVADDAAALREMSRVLRPGGVLLVNLPAFEFLRSAHDAVIHTRHRYTRREIKRKLAEAGLVVQRATYWNTTLFPALALVRLMRKGSGGETAESDLRPVARWPNATLLALIRAEAWLLRRVSLIFGLSIFCVATRPVGR